VPAGLAGGNAPTNSSFWVRSDAGKAPIRSRTSANWRRGRTHESNGSEADWSFRA